jgi:hypothetical protein
MNLSTRRNGDAIEVAESELSRSESMLLLGAFAALAASLLSFTTL